MLVFTSLFFLLGGTVLACTPDRYAERRFLLERCSGMMLVLGLSILGGSLPLFR